MFLVGISNFAGYYPGVESLGHRAYACVTLVSTTKYFSDVVVPIYIAMIDVKFQLFISLQYICDIVSLLILVIPMGVVVLIF